MANTNHKWTSDEERDSLSLSPEDFRARYPDITAAAYRIRRNKLMRGDTKSTLATDPTAIDRAVRNNIKMARSIIRLRHSIEADDELALAIPLIRNELQSQAHDGRVTGLEYDELRRLIYGA